MRFIVLLTIVLFPGMLEAQAPAGADSALAQELRARVRVDQAARELMGLLDRSGEVTPGDMLLISVVDSLNTGWLKRIVAENGWPKQSQIGAAATHNAWLLVQHADADPEFQEKVLELLEIAVAEGEASGSELAYLTDRVRTAQGKPQLYGTQLRRGADGEWEPFPIEAPDSVDARRAEVGLPPMAEYVEQLKAYYEGAQ